MGPEDKIQETLDRHEKRLSDDDKRLALLEMRLKINNWLSLAIASGIVALVVKIFMGG